ncbi:hypothetical protein FIBSPDRAFT_869166 [Athelia psychrophila]|uniref:Uncharacterized protein n=1 Tax=Athelia psychrophila TaxID=1759441 RepID=A0A166CCG2_9AGAM|nr:hypothetical protein FIBSPDRAFT_869166 [Fibularhizoctonia sp. CBS 109695]
MYNPFPIAEHRTRGTHIHPGYSFLSERFALAYLLFSPTPGRLHVTPIGRASDTTYCWGYDALPRPRQRTECSGCSKDI